MTAALFGLSLLVGFLTGVVSRDALDLLLSSPHSGRLTMRQMLRWLRDNFLTLAVIAVVLLNGVLGVLLIQQRDDLTDYSRCSATWQRDFGASYRARTEAAAEVSDATDKLIRAVASQDRAEFQSALENYIKVRERQDRQRAKNPLPEPPETLCGTPTQ